MAIQKQGKMRTIVIIVITCLCLSLQNCGGEKVRSKRPFNGKYLITPEDSAIIERTLLDNKNIMFTELYERSKQQTYNRKGIAICDTFPDRSYYYVYHRYDLRLTGNSKKEKLYNKWLQEEAFFIDRTSHEYPDGSLDFARSLEFYNSKDLVFFIDSLRQDYYKDLYEKKYKSNPPSNATVPYIPLK